MPAMSYSEEADKGDDCQFKWGKKRGVGGKKKKVQFYESFTYDGVEYSLYDCVCLYKEGEPEPYIGKLVKIWEQPENKKKIKALWFFRPIELHNFIEDGAALETELFLACGEGLGLANVNPLEVIVGKCNVICTSKDMRNPQPTGQDLDMADYTFYRTFDVANCTISDKIGDKVAGVEVKNIFNKNVGKQSSSIPQIEANGETGKGSISPVEDKEKLKSVKILGVLDDRPSKKARLIDNSSKPLENKQLNASPLAIDKDKNQNSVRKERVDSSMDDVIKASETPVSSSEDKAKKRSVRDSLGQEKGPSKKLTPDTAKPLDGTGLKGDGRVLNVIRMPDSMVAYQKTGDRIDDAVTRAINVARAPILRSEIEEFRKNRPRYFNGTGDVMEAQRWIEKLEKIFDLIQCTDASKVRLATFKLEDAAEHWWGQLRDSTEAATPGHVWTWAEFVRAFYDEYYPQSIQEGKINEFFKLQQGNMTIDAYVKAFTELGRFVPNMVADEMFRIRRFEQGLRPHIRTHVVAHRSATFTDLLDRCYAIERELNLANQGMNFGHQSYSGSQLNRRDRVMGKQTNRRKKKSTKTSQKCNACGKSHLGKCLKGTNACYNCGKSGHRASECKEPKKTSSGSAPTTITAHGRVYTLAEMDVGASDDVIHGTR